MIWFETFLFEGGENYLKLPLFFLDFNFEFKGGKNGFLFSFWRSAAAWPAHYSTNRYFRKIFFKENPVKHIRALLDDIMIIQGIVRPVKVLSGSLQGHWAPPQRLFQGSFSPHHHYFVSSPTSWVMTTTITTITTITIQPQEILPNARKLCSAESQVHFTMWMNLNRYLSQPPNRPEASETPWAASTQLDLAEVIFVLIGRGDFVCFYSPRWFLF